ncbi:hypothetical protein BC835DRAFT_1424049 [Cytidiella melzeri]|nr:hypothetical protein BC835DRAFT_1424049 [Cytidiella melzeri]
MPRDTRTIATCQALLRGLYDLLAPPSTSVAQVACPKQDHHTKASCLQYVSPHTPQSNGCRYAKCTTPDCTWFRYLTKPLTDKAGVLIARWVKSINNHHKVEQEMKDIEKEAKALSKSGHATCAVPVTSRAPRAGGSQNHSTGTVISIVSPPPSTRLGASTQAGPLEVKLKSVLLFAYGWTHDSVEGLDADIVELDEPDGIVQYFERHDIKYSDVVAVYNHNTATWLVLLVRDLTFEDLNTGTTCLWVKYGVTKLTGIEQLVAASPIASPPWATASQLEPAAAPDRKAGPSRKRKCSISSGSTRSTRARERYN